MKYSNFNQTQKVSDNSITYTYTTYIIETIMKFKGSCYIILVVLANGS